MFALRNSSAARLDAARVYEKHGSRKRPTDERFWGLMKSRKVDLPANLCRIRIRFRLDSTTRAGK
jgi:hypothetical protein